MIFGNTLDDKILIVSMVQNESTKLYDITMNSFNFYTAYQESKRVVLHANLPELSCERIYQEIVKKFKIERGKKECT